MKKVLFATTALVATAGVAAADVTFGGYGRFGIIYIDNGVTDSTDITHRYRLQIDATAESDGGVTFGARARIQRNAGDDNAAAGNAQGINGVRFFARAGGFEVGVGNIFGAIGSMPGQYPIDLGLTGLGYNYTAAAVGTGYFDEYSSGGNGAANANGIEFMYSAGNFSAHVSASDTNDRIAGYASYNWNDWTFALGLQDSNNVNDVEATVSASGSFGIADVTLAYAQNGADVDRIVLAGTFSVGAATTVDVYVADEDGAATTSYGLGFHHDLGGGTSLRGGVTQLLNDTTRADLGVRFNF